MKLRFSHSFALLGVVAGWTRTGTQSVHDIIGRLKSAPGGYKHVADDGVIRSFGPDGAVVDAARLTNAQPMKTALDHYDPDARKHLEEIWSGVDGHNVSDRTGGMILQVPMNAVPIFYAVMTYSVGDGTADFVFSMTNSRMAIVSKLIGG
ncbi:conserved hypothetical protein [Histoplasma capsulatum var. duboisii H88]|uniref:Uncharacterized protein n=1 Tax=Ajellomyces capsulatus (strain H88) TaxID=544711 RepID=F0UQX8_AJEC8|nr:conserved hypothetical protein [Histoplasma capsulatum var. duboisii H88]